LRIVIVAGPVWLDATVIWTVATPLPPLPSLTVYAKLSPPVYPAAGV